MIVELSGKGGAGVVGGGRRGRCLALRTAASVTINTSSTVVVVIVVVVVSSTVVVHEKRESQIGE